MRLIYEVDGGHVAYMAPNAFQARNAHSYHRDYVDEKRLYEKIREFVHDLDAWKCAKLQMSECLLDCIEMLVERSHLNSNELLFYKAWISDLNDIGYKWPKLARRHMADLNLVTETITFWVFFLIRNDTFSNK